VGGFFDYQLFRIGDTSVTAASLAAAVVVLIVSYVLARIARRLVTDRMLSRTHLSTGVRYMLGRFTGYLVLVLGAIVALQTIGIRATTLTAFGAALGVGIGFGLQDVVKNFVAGLILLIERPFQVGDRLEVQGVAAEVVEIRSRATVLRTNDDVHLIVPNSRFTNETIVNRSYDRPLYRCRAPVAVDTGSDPHAVEEALLEAARRCDGVLGDPAPSVRFRAYGDSGLKFELLCWTDKLFHRPGALVSRLNFEIYEALTRRGIQLPRNEVRLRTGDAEAPPRGGQAADGMEAAEASDSEVLR
jgi:small-conductance mechanosensitive channel